MEHLWNDTDSENPKYSAGDPSLTWVRLGPNPGFCS